MMPQRCVISPGTHRSSVTTTALSLTLCVLGSMRYAARTFVGWDDNHGCPKRADTACVPGCATQYFEDDWREVSAVAKAFIDSLLVINPTERLTAAQALKYVVVWLSSCTRVSTSQCLPPID